jgi:type I restriction enzyme R subunit
VVQARSFAEMLEQTIRRYQNRAIEAAQVIEELIQLAQDMREANARGEVLGLSADELAFYDALETNDSAVQVLGDATLRAIAQELVRTVRANVTIDWTLRENVRAQLRVLVKRAPNSRPYLAVVSGLMMALGRYRAVRQSAQRRADQSVP